MTKISDRTRLELEAGKEAVRRKLAAMSPADRAAEEETRERLLRLRKLQEWSQKGMVGLTTEHFLGQQGNRQLLMRISDTGPHKVTVGDETFNEYEGKAFPSADLFARVSLAVATGQYRNGHDAPPYNR